jgi:hypothetical protein
MNNKRILELADQALKECDLAKERGIAQYSIRFGQLIAEDCAKMLDEDSCWNPELGGYAHDIRTRYGVK